jgi:hypothetical protein
VCTPILFIKSPTATATTEPDLPDPITADNTNSNSNIDIINNNNNEEEIPQQAHDEFAAAFAAENETEENGGPARATRLPMRKRKVEVANLSATPAVADGSSSRTKSTRLAAMALREQAVEIKIENTGDTQSKNSKSLRPRRAVAAKKPPPSLYYQEDDDEPKKIKPKMRVLRRIVPEEEEHTIPALVEKEYGHLLIPDEPVEIDKPNGITYLIAHSNSKWEQHFRSLLIFLKIYGHTMVPKLYEDNAALAKFVANCRKWKKMLDREEDCPLTDSRLKRLQGECELFLFFLEVFSFCLLLYCQRSFSFSQLFRVRPQPLTLRGTQSNNKISGEPNTKARYVSIGAESILFVWPFYV